MSGNIEVAILQTLALIAEKEKLKAINEDDYGTAFFVSILEGLFREVGRSARKKT